MVQWLRRQASNVGGVGLIPAQGTTSHRSHDAVKTLKEKKKDDFMSNIIPISQS